ncbi:hypothetical protein KKA14_01700 [bacterium]|nr:hypothetical protein [bacterium]
MTVEYSIKPYDITCGEKVKYGVYAALEIVFQRYINKLELFFFDEYKLAFDFDFKIKTGIRFNKYLESLKQPSPIFVFQLHPEVRNCLLIADNRIINLILAKSSLFENGKAEIPNNFQINAENSMKIKSTFSTFLDLFQDSWESIHNVKSELKKLVSNRIKAKIMDPTESCIICGVTIKQKRFKSEWEFCFSNHQLDRIIEKHGTRALLNNHSNSPGNPKIREFLSEILIQETTYELKGILGQLEISPIDLIESFNKKKVIPLKNEISNNVIVMLSDHQILSAIAGETNQKLSLQVNGKYETAKKNAGDIKKRFSKIKFSRE